MIWRLRNMAVHIWLAALGTVPVCFYLLPRVSRILPELHPVIGAAILTMGTMTAISLSLDVAAKKILSGLIREGEAWERAGITAKAAKNYTRAVRLFDSFLLWPFGAGKITARMAGVLARFALNTGIENDNFRLAILVYLKRNPSDDDIALLWVKRLKRSRTISAAEQDLLTRLAGRSDMTGELTAMLADIFLGLGRRDFAARQLYTRMLDHPEAFSEYTEPIQAVVGDLAEQEPAEPDLHDSGIGGMVIPDRAPLPQHEPAPLHSRVGRFFRRLELGHHMAALVRWAAGVLRQAVAAGLSGVTALMAVAGHSMAYIRSHDRFRFYFKSAVLTAVGVALIYFAAGTVFHLSREEAVEAPAQLVSEEREKPFTIQVAAYLKQSHADRYVTILKKKGLDARFKKVAGGGKTWFVVHVSEFEDKKSAASFGQSLKAKKVIDDFFVNNK